jgi:hypothetical protein
VGEHKFKVSFTKGDFQGSSVFTFKVEEGGIISAHGLNGLIQDGKLILKEHDYPEQGKAPTETEFDGEFESQTVIKGSYKSNNTQAYDPQGTFTMTKE